MHFSSLSSGVVSVLVRCGIIISCAAFVCLGGTAQRGTESRPLRVRTVKRLQNERKARQTNMKNPQKRLCSVVLILAIMLSVGVLPVTASAAAEKKPSVTLTNQRLIVNGKEAKIEVYNIDGSNYFKLRDIAMLLKGTKSEFGIEIYQHFGRDYIYLGTTQPYKPVGGELVVGKDKSATAVLNEQFMAIETTDRRFTMYPYNIGGNNFFKLRDLAGMFYFDVDYDGKTNTVTITTRDPATAKVIGWDESHAKVNSYYEGITLYEGEKEGFWFNDFQMQYKLGSGPRKPGVDISIPWDDMAIACGFDPDIIGESLLNALFIPGSSRTDLLPAEDWEKFDKMEAEWIAEHGFDSFKHDWQYYYPEYD